MAVVMVAMLAFGGTYAYFTARTDAGSGSLTTGKVVLTAGTAATVTDAIVMPGDTLKTAGAVKSEATRGAYVGIKLTLPDTNTIPETYLTVTISAKDGDTTTKFVQSGDYFVYSTDGTNAAIVGGDSAETTVDFAVAVTLTWETPDTYQNTPISYTIKAYSIQAANCSADNVAEIVALFTEEPTAA